MAPDQPYVVAHTAVSVEGSTVGFHPDVSRFYELAATWAEDATLTGADTILTQEPALEAAPGPGPLTEGPLLAVVDGRGRVSRWDGLRDAGRWSGVLALHSRATPPRPADRNVPELVAGDERVDLAAVLATLREDHGVETVRVDSGGQLTGALLHAGLLDEVSLLVHPCLAGADGDRFWYGTAPPPGGGLYQLANEALGDGLVWLRYLVKR
ncbi:RibD family protein [Thermomonospora umbrina]|uniref:2,5-diamino-6-(Ribosylamino)-4(3H)-pyrimidinone 5'-phosphate reductase n=1 Tax=Thermomonospora umbrina TaxID=111806 RepID=A0A3D9SIS2_9ACTN|nr:dihydrofolate reductase family protein [Thermomonospora umbrina]REE95802.1 2,5-diamino-6-(ribosylamino)-4(3H)-pyrimidinone 5'-phosphate reductase [Thermomonospora umbrina]